MLRPIDLIVIFIMGVLIGQLTTDYFDGKNCVNKGQMVSVFHGDIACSLLKGSHDLEQDMEKEND